MYNTELVCFKFILYVPSPVCIDVLSRKRYSPGERFISGNKCCACEEGRIDCASSVNTCYLGEKALLLKVFSFNLLLKWRMSLLVTYSP